MTFDEIPRFTKQASWRADMDIETLVKRIEVWVDEYGLQLNPDFQRGHVWTEEQQIAFVEFIPRGGMTGRDLYFNHPGWMVDFEGEFVCVDGLQRITALQRFANNEIKPFGQYFREFGGRLNLLHHYMTAHINNLKTRKEVLRWYIEMNEGGTPHSKEEIARVRTLMERSPAPHKRRTRGAER
ncbi:MAG: DUF262 domain-containing protein [Oscillospiraceae bacterium]|nr:DUF262 domain-containing protein [Oscillospiraceae bacterium]